MSVTSLDPSISRTLEPRAPAGAKRIAAIRCLQDAGVPTLLAVAPVVPQITDHELETIVAAGAAAGARAGFYLPIRLPHEVAPLFRAWLDEHYPDRASKVMATIQSMRGGKDNDPNFFTRMQGEGPWADLLRTRFAAAARKAGLGTGRLTLRRDLFRPPEGRQMRLL
jgi:DNA repair photolyase